MTWIQTRLYNYIGCARTTFVILWHDTSLRDNRFRWVWGSYNRVELSALLFDDITMPLGNCILISFLLLFKCRRSALRHHDNLWMFLSYFLHFVNYSTEGSMIRPSAGDLPIRFTFEWPVLMSFNSLLDGLLLFYIRKSATRKFLTDISLPHWSSLMLLEWFQWNNLLGQSVVGLFP